MHQVATVVREFDRNQIGVLQLSECDCDNNKTHTTSVDGAFAVHREHVRTVTHIYTQRGGRIKFPIKTMLINSTAHNRRSRECLIEHRHSRQTTNEFEEIRRNRRQIFGQQL